MSRSDPKTDVQSSKGRFEVTMVEPRDEQLHGLEFALQLDETLLVAGFHELVHEGTGRTNYRAFMKWAKSIDPAAPNFENEPERVVTDPWEGLGPIWYWSVGNPKGRSLNRYADDNNIEMVTRRINGGLNG